MDTIGSLVSTIFVVAAILIPQILEFNFKTRRSSDSEEYEFDSLPAQDQAGQQRNGICGFRAG